MCGVTAFKYDWPNVLFKFSLNLLGRSISQMMIRWFFKAESRMQSVWNLCKAKSHSSGCFSAYFHSAYYFTNDTNPYLVHLPPSLHCNSNWQRRQIKAFSLPFEISHGLQGYELEFSTLSLSYLMKRNTSKRPMRFSTLFQFSLVYHCPHVYFC